jgi:hypothetical protein
MPKYRIDRPETQVSLSGLHRELERLELRLREVDSKIAARLRWFDRVGSGLTDTQRDAPLMLL